MRRILLRQWVLKESFEILLRGGGTGGGGGGGEKEPYVFSWVRKPSATNHLLHDSMKLQAWGIIGIIAQALSTHRIFWKSFKIGGERKKVGGGGGGWGVEGGGGVEGKKNHLCSHEWGSRVPRIFCSMLAWNYRQREDTAQAMTTHTIFRNSFKAGGGRERRGAKKERQIARGMKRILCDLCVLTESFKILLRHGGEREREGEGERREREPQSNVVL